MKKMSETMAATRDQRVRRPRQRGQRRVGTKGDRDREPSLIGEEAGDNDDSATATWWRGYSEARECEKVERVERPLLRRRGFPSM